MTRVKQKSVPPVDISPVQRVGLLSRDIKALETQIADAEKAMGIDKMKKDLEAKVQAYTVELKMAVGDLEFTEDHFLKALKKKGESYQEGEFKIIRTARTQREIRLAEFMKAFPATVLLKCAKIGLTDADKTLGKDVVEKYVDKKVTYSYDLMDMEEVRNYGSGQK